MRARRSAVRLIAASILTLAAAAQPRADGPRLSRQDRGLARDMLASVKSVLERTYYDRTFHGIDIAARLESADVMIEHAPSLAHAYTVIAQALLALGDSHTFFVPPARPSTHQNGWAMQMIGDECLVAAVDPSSDAAAKGFRPGDRVLRLEGFIPTRSEFWKLQYAYSSLAPRPILSVVVQSPGGSPRRLEASARSPRGPSTVAMTSPTPECQSETARRAPTSRKFARLLASSRSGSWRPSTCPLRRSIARPMRFWAERTRSSSICARILAAASRRWSGYGRLVDRDITIANRSGRRPMKPLVARARRRVPGPDVGSSMRRRLRTVRTARPNA